MISDQLSYWSDNILTFFVVNIFLMLGLVDQLGQSQETPAIKDGELPVEQVSGARVSLVCPFFGNGESASGCTLQDQGFHTGD
jgi:hypothetical protein